MAAFSPQECTKVDTTSGSPTQPRMLLVQPMSRTCSPLDNVTGFTPIVGWLGGKWVELLRDIAPRVAKVTLLFNPPTATFVEGYLNPFRAAAASLGVEAIVAPLTTCLRAECLNARWFMSLADAREKMEDWRKSYSGRACGVLTYKEWGTLIRALLPYSR